MRGKANSRKKSPPSAAPASRSRSTLPLVGTVGRGLVALAIVSGVMMAVVWVAGRTGRVVAPRDRYAVNFADIQCPTPPSGDRLRFLVEVRYLDDLPERVQNVDPNLKPRLTHAFKKHPWVESVEGIQVTPAGEIVADLTFRQPVLAVTVMGELMPRLVDKAAVQLPGDGQNLAVSKLITPQPPPPTPPGQLWANSAVKFAATLAVTYRPKTIERTKLGFKLILLDGREQMALWGGA